MPTPLRDMAPWRRSLTEHGLTFAWLAQRTGKSPRTVRAYSNGARKAPAEWIATVEGLLADYEKETAA